MEDLVEAYLDFQRAGQLICRPRGTLPCHITTGLHSWPFHSNQIDINDVIVLTSLQYFLSGHLNMSPLEKW